MIGNDENIVCRIVDDRRGNYGNASKKRNGTERIGAITVYAHKWRLYVYANDYGHPRVYGVDKLIIIVLLDSCRRFNSSRTRLPRLRWLSCRCDGVLRNARSHGM